MKKKYVIEDINHYKIKNTRTNYQIRQDNRSYVTLKCAHIFTIKCVIKTDRVELGRKAEVEDNTTTTMYQERMRVRQRILTS